MRLNETLELIPCHLPNDQCWEYQGYINEHGYGRCNTPSPNRQQILVHRLVYELSHGIRLTSADVVRHTCDNPACTNPNHLLIGTQADSTLR